MSERQLVTVQHSRQCVRCGTERTIETGEHQRAPEFTGWTTHPYSLCPQCTLSLAEWWKGA